jgi:hypothetical protein
MTTHATAPRFASEPLVDSIESAIAAAGRRTRVLPVDLAPILIRYWQALPRHDTRQRRAWLDACRESVRTGAATTRVFAVQALGDCDEDIVFTAVTEYLGALPVSVERRQAAVEDTLDWIRRGLALNRGALFAAVLLRGDGVIDEALGGLRLILTHAECEVVCRRAAERPSGATRVFLAEWLALMETCDSPNGTSRGLVAAALAAVSV